MEADTDPGVVHGMAVFYSNAIGAAFDRDAPRNRGFESIVHEFGELMAMGTTLQRIVRDRAAQAGRRRDVPPALAAQWVEEARKLDSVAGRMRGLADECRSIVAEFASPRGREEDRRYRTVLFFFGEWFKQTGDVADAMEDLAETLALAAHKPFRDAVEERLRTPDPA